MPCYEVASLRAANERLVLELRETRDTADRRAAETYAAKVATAHTPRQHPPAYHPPRCPAPRSPACGVALTGAGAALSGGGGPSLLAVRQHARAPVPQGAQPGAAQLAWSRRGIVTMDGPERETTETKSRPLHACGLVWAAHAVSRADLKLISSDRPRKVVGGRG